jgi:hypothetical protein
MKRKNIRIIMSTTPFTEHRLSTEADRPLADHEIPHFMSKWNRNNNS